MPVNRYNQLAIAHSQQLDLMLDCTKAVSCSSAALGMTNLKEFGDHLLSNQYVAACQPTADQPLQTKTYVALI